MTIIKTLIAGYFLVTSLHSQAQTTIRIGGGFIPVLYYTEWFSNPGGIRPGPQWHIAKDNAILTSASFMISRQPFAVEYSLGTSLGRGMLEKFPAIPLHKFFAGYDLARLVSTKNTHDISAYLGVLCSRANFHVPRSWYLGAEFRANIKWIVFGVNRSFAISKDPVTWDRTLFRSQRYTSITVGLSIPVWRSKKKLP